MTSTPITFEEFASTYMDSRLQALADRAAAIVYPASDELAEYAPAISSADPAIAPMQSHHEIAFLRSELYVTCQIVQRHDPRVCYQVGKVNKKTVTDPSGMRFDLLAIRPAKWTESEYRYHLENFWRMTYADNLPPGQSMPWGIEDLPRSQSKDFAAGDRVAIDNTDRPGLLLYGTVTDHTAHGLIRVMQDADNSYQTTQEHLCFPHQLRRA